MNEYLAIDSGGYLYEHPSRIDSNRAGCPRQVEMMFD